MDIIIYQECGFPGYELLEGVWRECLKLCVESIHVHSPSSRIVIIGDKVKDFDYVPQANFLSQYNKLVPYYEHFSPNSPDFELRSIRRWFVINEYVQTIEMDQFIHLDSDVLCFCDFSRLENEMRKTSIWSPHASFTGVFDRHGLAMFCKAILWIYRHKDSKAWKRMRDRYIAKASCTGISDMNLMEWFMSTRKHLDLCDWATRTDVIDTNICHCLGYMVDGDRKRLFFLNGFPYAVAVDGRIVRMNTLHCWGPYKDKMAVIWKRSRDSVGNPNPIPFNEQGKTKTSKRFLFW